jgi:hypothetical protein
VPNGEVHVLPSERGWRVEVDAEERARSVHSTQAEAISAARELARSSGRELLIHGRDGEIRDRMYGGNGSSSPTGGLRRLTSRPVPAWSLALVAVAMIVTALAVRRVAR